MALLTVAAGACSDSSSSQPSASPTTGASTTTAVAATAPVTTAPTTRPPDAPVPAVTTPATTARPPGDAPPVLEPADAGFLGIAPGSLLADAAQALGATPVPLDDIGPGEQIEACTGTPEPRAIRSGGLTLVFEAASPETATLTNWTYTGGPVAGFAELVAPRNVRIGDSRSAVVAAHPDHVDYGAEITVSDPYLELVFDGDILARFGVVECVVESAGD